MTRRQGRLGRILAELAGNSSMFEALAMYYDLAEAAEDGGPLARKYVPIAAVTCLEVFYRQVGRLLFSPEGRMHTPVNLRITAADLPELARVIDRLGPADLFWLDRGVQSVDGIRSVQDELGMASVFKGDPGLLDSTGRLYYVRNDIVHGMGDKRYDMQEAVLTVRTHIEKCLAQIPPLLAVFRLIGGIRAGLRGDRRAAEGLYRRAVAEADGSKVDPSVLHVIAGKAAEGLGRRDEAISRFKRAASADPRNADAHASLGRIFALEGRNEDALERYDRAVEIDPGYANAHIGRGSALARLGRPRDALESYRLAAKADPSNIEPHMAAGRVHESQGRADDALESYRLAAKADPSRTGPYMAAGQIHESQGRADDALESYRLAASADASSMGPHMAAGRVHESQGRADDALESYRLAAKADPSRTGPYMAAGRVHESQGRADDALESYRLAASADASSMEPHMAAGRVHESQGRADDALESYRLAAKVNASSMEPHMAAGRVHESQGRAGDALESYLAARVYTSNTRPHKAANALDRTLDSQVEIDSSDEAADLADGKAPAGDEQAGALKDTDYTIRHIRRLTTRGDDDRKG